MNVLNREDQLNEECKKITQKIREISKEFPDYQFSVTVRAADDEKDHLFLLLGNDCPVCVAARIGLLHMTGQITHRYVEGTNMEDGHMHLSVTPKDDDGKEH